MAALKQAFGGQIGLGGFGEGNVVKLDGGKRMRLDDKVDFWPGTQVWCTVGIEPPIEGLGVSSMLAFLKQARADAGRPVAELAPRESARKVTCSYCGKPAQLHGGRDVYPDRKDLECWLPQPQQLQSLAGVTVMPRRLETDAWSRPKWCQ